MPEIRLVAPAYFDPGIGYWTGEPDLAALERALAAVPPHPEVERLPIPGGVVLRGPEGPVRDQARRLRAAGLFPVGPSAEAGPAG